MSFGSRPAEYKLRCNPEDIEPAFSNVLVLDDSVTSLQYDYISKVGYAHFD